MKKTVLLAVLTLSFAGLHAQAVFMTRHGQISFSGKTALENVEALNNEVSSALNMQTGEIGFAALIKSFHFEKALMEEHFNENYMESDNIPKASFKGKITNISSVDAAKDGSHPVTASGDLTIHGVTKQVSIPGTLLVKDGQVQLVSKFKIAPKDYNIKIPSLVADKIAEQMNISVDCKYDKK